MHKNIAKLNKKGLYGLIKTPVSFEKVLFNRNNLTNKIQFGSKRLPQKFQGQIYLLLFLITYQIYLINLSLFPVLNKKQLPIPIRYVTKTRIPFGKKLQLLLHVRNLVTFGEEYLIISINTAISDKIICRRLFCTENVASRIEA